MAVADGSDLVVLAVKPNVLDEVAPDLVQAGTPVLSILAGTTHQEPSTRRCPESIWCG